MRLNFKNNIVRSLLSISILITVLVSACTVTWVPKYDAELETQISNIAKQTNKLYLGMLGVNRQNRIFETYSLSYYEILAEIKSIELKIEGKRKNKNFLVLVKNVEKNFKKYINEHKSKRGSDSIKYSNSNELPKELWGTLTDGEVLLYDRYMQDVWKPLYLAQRGIKENN